MMDCDEDGLLLINDLKMKWFTLLSRVDASPTIDETILTSLNSIANMLISNRPPKFKNDLLFAVALRLGFFESIFRWNFVFCGSDLEAFKAKELQFYDTLVTGEGQHYLQYPEFALPLLATLHHCAIRSSLPVERILVRTLNSVCAAMCAQFSEFVVTELSHNGMEDECNDPAAGPELVADLSFFKRLSMGLVSDCRYMESKFGQSTDSAQHTPDSTEPSSVIKVSDAVDWPLSIEPKAPCPADTSFRSLERSLSCASHDSASNIDSIFDLLIPFVFREGDLGWQARDAFLLVATYSNKDEEFSYGIAQYTSVCPVLATGLATLYAELPRELVSDNYPQSWPDLVQTLEEHKQTCSKFVEFFGALEFCESVLEVAHPLIQSSLLQYIHSGFFVSVLGFSLTKSNVQEVITATVFLKEIVMRTTNSAILPALLRFLLTEMPEDKSSVVMTELSTGVEESKSDREIRSPLSDLSDIPEENRGYSSNSRLTYMDLLISRLHYCNTLLGVATLSLFNTLLNLNCEDVMFYLVLRHLVPFRDALFDFGWSWPEPNTFVRASDSFLNLIASYEHESTSRLRKWQTPVSADFGGSVDGSVAELNLDEDTEANETSPECAELAPSDNSRGKANMTAGTHDRPDLANMVIQGQRIASLDAPMEVLMPAHSESISSPVMNVVDELAESNGNKMEQFKDLFRRRKPQSPGPQNVVAITPDDWLKYTSWARESIYSRVQACTRWRLVFDAVFPNAEQIASLQQSWNGANSQLKPEDTYADELSNAIREQLRIKSKPSVALSHSRFKCFVNHNPVVANEKEKQGERKAQALHSAVTKLDIDVELDLEEMDDSLDLRREDSFKSLDPTPKLNGVPNYENHSNGSASETDIEFHSFPTLVPTSSPRTVGSNIMEPQGSNSSDSTYPGDADSTDSGCLITESKSIQENNVCPGSIRTSSSDHNISSNRPSDFAFSSTANEVKSWYCLNFIDSDTSDRDVVDRTENKKHIGNQDELHEVDLSLECASVPQSMVHQNGAFDLNRKDVRALLDASKQDNFDQFVNCLEGCTAFDPAEVKQTDFNKDVQHCALYFDSLLANDSERRKAKMSSSVSVEMNGTIPAKSCNGQKSVNHDDLAISNLDSGSHTLRIESNGHTENSQTSYSNKELCTEKQFYMYAHPTTTHCGEINGTSAHLPHKLVRSVSYEPPNENNLSSRGTYEENPVRRHSIQTSRTDHDAVDDRSESTAEADPKQVNSAQVPNLGPFLTTILARLESLPHNCFYANLYLTSILSSLASYPQPLLRAIMLFVPPLPVSDLENNASVKQKSDSSRWRALQEAYSQLPHARLCSVRRQLDVFSIQYTMCPPDGMSMPFMSLVIDAKEYFQYAKESPTSVPQNIVENNRPSDVVDEVSKHSRKRIPFLRRLFTRSRKTEPKSASSRHTDPLSVEDSTLKRVSAKLSPQAYSQPSKTRINPGQFTLYKWLPEIGFPLRSELTNSKRKRVRHSVKKSSRSNSIHAESGSKDVIDWPAVQRMVLCAVVFEEFCKEMAALCIEHSVRN